MQHMQNVESAETLAVISTQKEPINVADMETQLLTMNHNIGKMQKKHDKMEKDNTRYRETTEHAIKELSSKSTLNETQTTQTAQLLDCVSNRLLGLEQNTQVPHSAYQKTQRPRHAMTEYTQNTQVPQNNMMNNANDSYNATEASTQAVDSGASYKWKLSNAFPWGSTKELKSFAKRNGINTMFTKNRNMIINKCFLSNVALPPSPTSNS